MNINPLEAGLAFVEGLALIASPCILPVLPLVLSGGVEGGKARPFGITFGFVAAFSLFVLASRQIIGFLHIDNDTIRYGSLMLLALLGLVMLSETLSKKFSVLTQSLAELGNKVGVSQQGGFGSGIAIGALIGLVWTPCAGPILAAVLVQVIRQQTNLQSIAVTLSFAGGAALPMLAITLAGKKLMTRFRFLSRHAEAVRKIFALLILLSVAYMAFGASAANIFTANVPPTVEPPMALQDGLEHPYPAPELAGIQAWLNSEPQTLQQLRGKVVLIDFWTYSCINCVRTLPYVTSWDGKYRDQGLVVIGVHAPEFEFEKNIDNIKAAIDNDHIHYPVAVDNNLATWVNYKNRYWPAHYLIDKQGNVVYTHFGEGKYDETENNIRYLLGLKDRTDFHPLVPPTVQGETPETYLGYARANSFIALMDQQKDVLVGYKPTNFIPEHHWSLSGQWTVKSDKIIAGERGAYLRLNFKAKKVYLVMGTADGQPQDVTLTMNGAVLWPDNAGKDVVRGGVVTINGHTLYEIVNQNGPENSQLEITAEGPGVEMYAFTFGE